MKEVKIVSLDDRGRVVIPQIIRESLGLRTNSQVMMVADSEAKEIKITPVGLDEKRKPIKLRITMEDVPGALAKIARTFGSLGISLMYGESVILEKEKKAMWTVISPTPSIPLDDLEEKLKKEGDALNVKVVPL